MLAGEFLDVAVQVLGAHLVKGPHVGTLEHRPEGLSAVGVRLAPDVLGDRVLDRFMVPREPGVGRCLVGVDHRIRGRVFEDEALQGVLGGVGHDTV